MAPIRVGWLSSYNTRCGISEYSRYLVSALRKRDDVDVTVFGSKNYDHYKIASDPSYVVPTFGVLPWNTYGDHSFDGEAILRAELDVLHVQYEVVLYNQEGFNNLLERFPGIKAITYHDNCIPPGLPFWRFHLSYTHREDVGVGEGYVLPMGIGNHTPVVKTFGLGRSRRDLIEPICERNGWHFEYSFGERNWLDQEHLYNWLRDSDLIVLYYEDAAAAGTSIAARVALSTRRPVIVNNTTWFKDLIDEHIPNLTVVNNPVQLEQYMQDKLQNKYIEDFSWDKIADQHIQDYKEQLDAISIPEDSPTGR